MEKPLFGFLKHIEKSKGGIRKSMIPLEPKKILFFSF